MPGGEQLASLVRRASDTLRGGGLVALPTDTQYALAALAADGAAVMRCYALKRRPDDDPMPIFLPSLAWLDRVAADVPPAVRAVVADVWPGGLTLVLRRNPAWRSLAVPGPTVAVRIPDHPLALALLAALDEPITGSSANRHGQPAPRRAAEVRAIFGDALTVLPELGVLPKGAPSTMLDWTGAEPRVLRAGALAPAQIDALLQRRLAASG